MKKILLLSAAVIAAAGPAHADPVSAIATWIAVNANIGLATAFAIANTAVGFGATILYQALARPEQQRVEANVKFDVEIGDELPLRFTVGDYATAGQRKYVGSWGKNRRFITEVIEVSSLPQDYDGMWVNDEKAEPFDGYRGHFPPPILGGGPDRVADIFETTSVPSGSYDMGIPLKNLSKDGTLNKATVWVKWKDGKQTAADPLLQWVFGEDEDYPWTADHIGRGKSYVVVTTQYNEDDPTGHPRFLFQPAPLPMYDWRKDSTNGGVGPHRWGNRSTYEPTRNPAVIAYNVARGIYYGSEWVFGGKNLAAWRLPVAEWSAAANECDDTVTLANGGTQPRYRCGMEVAADMEPAGVLEELGKAANMRFAEVGGRLKPIVGLPGSAVLSITDGDILISEGQSFNPFYPVSETFNAISATYPEPGEKWTAKDAPEYIDTDAQAEDGQYLPTSLSYGAVPYARQVQRLMRSQMRDFRRMRRHQFHLPPDAYGLEPGIDLISWTSNRNGYINKLFMVESVSKTPGMNVAVSLREVNPADYDWSSDFERPVVITPPKNPRPFVQPISGLTVQPATVRDEAGIARRPAILVSCDGDEAGVNRIQIVARVAGRTELVIDTLRRFDEPFAWYLTNVLPEEDYQVQARLLSDITPRSAWSGWLNVATPAVKFGSKDVEFEAIKDEVRESLGDLYDWVDGTGAVLRRVRDEIDAIRDLSTEQDFGALLDRQQIRTELAVEAGKTRAAFEDQIDVVVGELASQARRTTTLRAEFNRSVAGITQDLITYASDTKAVASLVMKLRSDFDGNVATVNEDLLALSREDEALAGRINEVAAGIGPAVGEATEALITRVTRVETVAGTRNRVYRQGTAPTGTTDNPLVSGDLWFDTSNKNKPHRWSGDPASWVGVQDGEIPELREDLTVVSDAVTRVSARTDRGTASGLFRMTAVSAPDGASSRIALVAEASDDSTTQSPGLFIEAGSDGTNQIIAAANRFSIATGTGPAASRKVPFVVDNGNVYMGDAFVRTLSIGPNALYVPYSFTRADLDVPISSDISNRRVLFDRTIPDFEGGGYSVEFSAYYDATGSIDAFGAAELLLDNVRVSLVRFGVRGIGGPSIEAMFPVNVTGTASGSGSTRIIVRAWNSRWNDISQTSADYTLREMTLTVSGTRR